MNDAGYISELQSREVKHLERIVVLEKALVYYADEKSWRSTYKGGDGKDYDCVYVEGGKIARAALADTGKAQS